MVNLGDIAYRKLLHLYIYINIYICDELLIICNIWVSLMWILEKYDDIILKRGIANLGRSHRLPRVFNNFHQFP